LDAGIAPKLQLESAQPASDAVRIASPPAIQSDEGLRRALWSAGTRQGRCPSAV